MDLTAINGRIDDALIRNRRAENIIVGMAIAIFALGMCIVAVAYWIKNPYVAGSSFAFQGALYWPIREVLKLRRENLMLQTVPAIVSTLPQDKAAQEIAKMLAVVRGDKHASG